MSKLGIAKEVAKLVVGGSVAKVVTDIILINSNVETRFDRVKVVIASVSLGSMVADAAAKHVEAKIDEYAEAWQHVKEKAEEARQATS